MSRKALDILEAGEIRPPDCSVLTGDDLTLKILVQQCLQTCSKVEHGNTEKNEVKSADEIAKKIFEGTLFGERFLVFDFAEKAKWGKTDKFRRSLIEAKENKDIVVIKAEDLPTVSPPLTDVVTEIVCKHPSHNKTRQKLIKLRLEHYKLKASDEAVKRFTDRSEFTAEIETTCTVLHLAFPEGHTVTPAEVEKASAEPPARKDITRALLKGNLPRLQKEINEGAPLYVLVVLFNNLHKLYTYLQMDDAKKEEEEICTLLGLPPRFRKEWHGAKGKYSSLAVRELLNVVAESYDSVIHGREHWKSKLLDKFRRTLT